MSKILAYCPLHYGAEYLDAAIRSIEPFVDKIVILYTPEPSYGFGTIHRCPESREQLFDIALNAAGGKIQWVDMRADHEGDHRGLIYGYADGYDGILAFDADEVFEPADMQSFIDQCMASEARFIGVDGYVNFWKSFNWACHDGFRPIRFYNLHNGGGVGVAKVRIYHFSTAQSFQMMDYKLKIHGHRNEIRPEWLHTTYKLWTPQNNYGDLHLVAYGLWNAIPFDKTTLPDILKQHPNYHKEEI